MSQASQWGMQTEGPASPVAVALRVNASFNALLSDHSGPSEPAYKVKGTRWLDTSESPHPAKRYDGAQWIVFAYMDPTAHTWTPVAGATIDIADVTGLQAALDAKVPTSRSVNAGGLLTGGGDLSASRTLTLTNASQGEAEAGVRNDVGMTPLRVAQAIEEQVPAATTSVPGRLRLATEAEDEAGELDNVASTPAGVAAAIAGAVGGGAPTVQHFTSSGTYTPTAGKTWAIMEGVGGGGGGGGSQVSQPGAGGGGAGAYVWSLVDLSSITSETVTIGGAGSGGTNSGNGSAGGDTSVGSIIHADGGSGGQSGTNGGNGGSGGTTGASTGQHEQAGQQGGQGGPASGIGGDGGSSGFGFGGRGGLNNNGTTGTGYGSGGGGCHNATGSSGGSGRAGYVRITEF